MRPEFKNKGKSIERAESLLAELPDQAPVDLIVLPEMALIGYRFEDKADIEPFLETVPTDIDALLAILDDDEENNQMPCTFKWAFKVSRRFQSAWVAVGFAEKDTQGNLFNSALLVNFLLRKLHTTRKVLLYEDDKKWCNIEEEVSGIENNFKSFELEFPRLQKSIKCGVGICMDINMKDFEEARYQERKLADAQVAEKTQMLIFMTAWCNPEPNY